MICITKSVSRTICLFLFMFPNAVAVVFRLNVEGCSLTSRQSFHSLPAFYITVCHADGGSGGGVGSVDDASGDDIRDLLSACCCSTHLATNSVPLHLMLHIIIIFFFLLFF